VDYTLITNTQSQHKMIGEYAQVTLQLTNLVQKVWPSFQTMGSWMEGQDVFSEPKDVELRQVPEDALFLSVLAVGKESLASDEMDHIYALLGRYSATKEGKLVIEPDYSLSVQELKQLITEKLCSSNKSLRALCYVEHLGKYSMEVLERTKSPSWIPEWHLPSKYNDITPHSS